MYAFVYIIVSWQRFVNCAYMQKNGAIVGTASQERSILHLIKGEIEGVLTREITVIFFLSRYYVAHFCRETAVK
jgi:hypothetical protein